MNISQNQECFLIISYCNVHETLIEPNVNIATFREVNCPSKNEMVNSRDTNTMTIPLDSCDMAAT